MDFSQRSSLFVLELINTAVSTWTAVLDTRHPLAVARTLGATPGQTGLGLAMAQLLPALPCAAGIPFAWRSQVQYPPGSWLLAPGLGILLTSLFSRPSPHSPSHDDQSRKHFSQPRPDSRSDKNHPRCQLTRRRPARKWSSARTSRRRQGARRPDVVLEEVGAGQLMPHRGTCSRRFRSERVSALPMSARITTCEHAQDRHRQVNPDQRIGRLILSHIRCAPRTAAPVGRHRAARHRHVGDRARDARGDRRLLPSRHAGHTPGILREELDGTTGTAARDTNPRRGAAFLAARTAEIERAAKAAIERQ